MAGLTLRHCSELVKVDLKTTSAKPKIHGECGKFVILNVK
jgi:hypothetical protein